MEKKISSKTLRKAFPFFILVVLIGLCAFVGNFRSGFIDNMKNVDDVSKDVAKLEWNFIEAVMYEDYLAAGNQAKVVAEDITSKLKLAYPDMQIMRYEFEHPQEIDDPEYLRIIRQSIQGVYFHKIDNDENDLFVCTRNGIIMDLSASTASSRSDWGSIYSRSANPTLSKNAVALLFNRSTSMVYWEHHMYHITDEKLPRLPPSPSIDALREVYMQYGVEGLKHVQFLAPAYITDTGDIFGIEDISVKGTATNNHKLVVIQTFNLYEQLMSRHHGELEKFNVFRTKLISENKAFLIEHAFIVVIVVILIVILTYFMMVFNNVVFHGTKNLENRSDGDNGS